MKGDRYNKNKIGDKNGFTLIELVLVLSIVGLISSVMIPKFSSIQVKAKEYAMKSVGRSLQVSLETYFLQEGGYILGKDVGIEAFIKELNTKKLLPENMINPFTKAAFSKSDNSGKVTYSWDEKAGKYSLKIYGKNNEGLLITLSNS